MDKQMESLGKMSIELLISLIIVFYILLYIVQYCWNNTISQFTKTSPITLWQTFLLLVLCHILFNNNVYITK